MTHTELIAICDQYIVETNGSNGARALLAVLLIHRPVEVSQTPHLTYCLGCQEMYLGTYPCNTLEAINSQFTDG